MAELAVIGGIGLAANIAIQGSVSVLIISGALYKYKENISNFMSYKWNLRKAKKMIKRGIKKIDYQLFVQGFRILRDIDRINNTLFYLKYLKKYNLTEEIINDTYLFKLKFDGEYLVNKWKSLNGSSTNLISPENKEEDEFFNFKKEKVDIIINNIESKYFKNQNNTRSFENDISLSDQTKEITEELEKIKMKSIELDKCLYKLYNFSG